MALSKVVQVGKELQAAGQRFIGHGFNDTIMLPYKTLLAENYSQYLTSNALFPTTPRGEIPASTVEEFMWKYFWLLNHYGVNLMRTSNGYTYSRLSDCFYNHRAWWDKIVGSMLKMANWNKVYIVFGFGSPLGPPSGGTPEQIAAWEANNAYKLGSPEYLKYVKLAKDIMPLYLDDPAILCWEIANEPDGDGPWRVWWSKLAGVPHDTNPTLVHQVAEQAWHDWSNQICNDIMPFDPTHLFTMGTAAGALMHGYGETDFKRANDHPCQITHQHIYGKRVSFDYDPVNDYFAKMKKWSNDLGKPCLLGEYGYDCWDYALGHYMLPAEYGGGQTDYAQLYSKWDTQVAYEVGIDAMASMMIPYYPDWPPSQALMDSIPPMPSEDPNPIGTVTEARFVDSAASLGMNALLTRR
jgi:hypothetical protein